MTAKKTNLVGKLRKLLSPDNLPRSRPLRIAIGVLLVLCGLVGFLPVLGFWMVPLGLGILAVDFPIARKALKKLQAVWDKAAQKFKKWRSKS